jgi:hypothetical protein
MNSSLPLMPRPGLPENGYNYEGESLINRNGNRSQFLIAPNNPDSNRAF